MNLSNCMSCGRLIISRGSHFCDECSRIQEEEFKKIKEYLSSNPRASLMEVYQGTGVGFQTIKDLITDKKIGLG